MAAVRAAAVPHCLLLGHLAEALLMRAVAVAAVPVQIAPQTQMVGPEALGLVLVLEALEAWRQPLQHQQIKRHWVLAVAAVIAGLQLLPDVALVQMEALHLGVVGVVLALALCSILERAELAETVK